MLMIRRLLDDGAIFIYKIELEKSLKVVSTKVSINQQ